MNASGICGLKLYGRKKHQACNESIMGRQQSALGHMACGMEQSLEFLPKGICSGGSKLLWELNQRAVRRSSSHLPQRSAANTHLDTAQAFPHSLLGQ